jgi:acetylornithine/succinyldiaminopimelate/putrescine aminotransferase
LSVVALTEKAAGIYKTGVYGNTMTTNPRGLEVGCAVLDSITDETRKNIRTRGAEFVRKFTNLKTEFPDDILRVVGTGLMVSVLLSPARFTVTGHGGFEQYLRKHGIEMIHGGPNGLRFTPHFNITSEEIDLIVGTVKQGLLETGLRTRN